MDLIQEPEPPQQQEPLGLDDDIQEHLYSFGQNTDFILRVENYEIHLHSQILRINSPVFDAILHNNNNKQHLTLNLTDELIRATPQQYVHFFRYFYPKTRRTHKVTKFNYDYLLDLAFYYDVQELVTDCENHIRYHVQPNLAIYLLAQKYNLQRLQSFIYLNLEQELWAQDIDNLVHKSNHQSLVQLITELSHNLSISRNNHKRTTKHYDRLIMQNINIKKENTTLKEEIMTLKTQINRQQRIPI